MTMIYREFLSGLRAACLKMSNGDAAFLVYSLTMIQVDGEDVWQTYINRVYNALETNRGTEAIGRAMVQAADDLVYGQSPIENITKKAMSMLSRQEWQDIAYFMSEWLADLEQERQRNA